MIDVNHTNLWVYGGADSKETDHYLLVSLIVRIGYAHNMSLIGYGHRIIGRCGPFVFMIVCI